MPSMRRGLLVAVAVYADQHHDIARSLRQAVERGLDVERAGGIGGAGHFPGRLVEHARLAQGVARAPAALREHGVDRDAVQPGRQLAAALEGRQRAPGGDEALLRAVLGQRWLAREPQAQAVDLSHVGAVQILEVLADHVPLDRRCGRKV